MATEVWLESPPNTLWTGVLSEVTLSFSFAVALLYPIYVPATIWAMFTWLRLEASMMILVACVSSIWWAEYVEWPAFGKNAVFEAWRRHFAFTVRGTERLPDRCIIAVVPHGLFPLSLVMLEARWAEGLRGLTKKPAAAIASVFFAIPFFAPMMEWLGCIPATRQGIRDVLSEDRACILLPDGIAGVYHGRSIYLGRRRGFLELAQETGAALVPVYCQGHTELFNVFPTHQQAPWFVQWVRRIRVALVLFWGSWLPFRPAKVPMTMMIGAPIYAIKGESLDDFRARFIDGLRTLCSKDVQIT